MNNNKEKKDTCIYFSLKEIETMIETMRSEHHITFLLNQLKFEQAGKM